MGQRSGRAVIGVTIIAKSPAEVKDLAKRRGSLAGLGVGWLGFGISVSGVIGWFFYHEVVGWISSLITISATVAAIGFGWFIVLKYEEEEGQ